MRKRKQEVIEKPKEEEVLNETTEMAEECSYNPIEKLQVTKN